MPSNGEEVKDVPLPENFVNTSKEGTNIFHVTPKSTSCQLPKVFGKVTFRKQALIGNANYLVEAMNKFAKGYINVERHKLKYGERMTTLLIESNEKLAIKQMEFELESQKLEFESRAQTQATQLTIAKMLGDILHAFV
jgi:enoyl reductase-like protein